MIYYCTAVVTYGLHPSSRSSKSLIRTTSELSVRPTDIPSGHAKTRCDRSTICHSLKKQPKIVIFGADTDNQIRDVVLSKCTPTYIKRKLLEEGQGLSLKRTLEVAAQCEKIETQLAALSIKGEELENINRVNERSNISRTSTQGRSHGRDQTCYRCGLTGHFGRDLQCPED